ncbi:MAG: RNA methyltransferase [Actinobacteria bacterium]|nr:RNA methyltransferase [Actinomycetota bacterium]
MIRTIAGRHNESVKLAQKLQKKKHRRDKGLFVCEGLDLLEAAIQAGESPVEVLVRDDLLDRLPPELLEEAEEDELDIGVCSAEVLEHASGLGGAADVVALFELIEWSLADLPLEAGVCVYLSGVGDPGNVGTIIRSAVAFGAVGVVCSPGTADPFGPKALRAGMGAQFFTRVMVEVSPSDLVAKIEADERRGVVRPTVVCADPAAEMSSSGLAVDGPVVLVMGAEREGPAEIPGPVLRVAIPQVGLDSLNVAMAATVLLYELSRPERGKPRGGLLA